MPGKRLVGEGVRQHQRSTQAAQRQINEKNYALLGLILIILFAPPPLESAQAKHRHDLTLNL